MNFQPYFKIAVKPAFTIISLSLTALILTSGFAYGQEEQVYFGSHTIHATQLCKEGKLDEAIEQIELAVRDSLDSSDFFTWYSRGFIYKEVYKKRDSGNPESPYREIAVHSFLKSRKLAGNVSEKTDNHDLALRFLANTYYNDALQATLKMDLDKNSKGIGYVEKYCSIMQAIQLADECPKLYADYYRACGQRFHELWTSDEKNKALWDQALNYYNEALKIKQHDCSISYNITALYCNLLVTYRNSNATISSATIDLLLNEAKLSLQQSTQDCETDSNYTGMIAEAKTLLTDLQEELHKHNHPSKN